MRQLLSFVLFVALAGCNQANLEREIAELRHENDLLKKQLAETRRILNETRAALLSLQGVKQDLEIDKRLGRLELEQSQIAAHRALEQAAKRLDGGVAGDATRADLDLSGSAEERAVRAKKRYEEAYVIKGSNEESAKQRLLEVMALLPDDHVYHKKARDLLARLGGPASLPDFESPPAMDGEGQSAADLRELGTAAYKRNSFSEAVAYYRAALKKNPKEFEIYRLMGSVYARQGNRKQAYESYRQYVRLCPKCMYTPAIEKILADYEELQR